MIQQRLAIVTGILSLSTAISANFANAQQFTTLQDAAADPFVVELLGEQRLTSLFEAELKGANQNGRTFGGDETHRVYMELCQAVRDMGTAFADRQWERKDQAVEFDAAEFLLSLEKMKLIQERSPYARLVGSLTDTVHDLTRKLDSDYRLYAWNVYSKSVTSQSPGVRPIVEQNFFVVPLSMREFVEEETASSYRTVQSKIEEAYTLAVGGGKGLLTAPEFKRLQNEAKKDAKQWYESTRSKFEKKVNQQALQFREAWFSQKVLEEIHDKARVKIIRNGSKANSLLNAAKNGLKYAKLNAESAIARAEKGQRLEAEADLKDARADALEGLEAASGIADILADMEKARLYMIPYVEKSTRMKSVVDMPLSKLEKAFRSLPGEGELAAIRNAIGFLIESTKTIENVKVMLAEAEELTAQAKPTIAASEQNVGAMFVAHDNAKKEAVAQTFDVSSRQAFDVSMSELAKTLPPEGQVKFYKTWGKLVQQAIAADPTLMSDEKNYLSFIRKHFENKTAADVIAP